MNPPAIDLSHTPGVYYALAYWLSAQVFLAVNERRHSRWRQALISGLFLLALSGFMIWTDGVKSWSFAVSMLAILGMIFLFFYGSAKADWKKSLYFLARIFILGEFAASFEYQLFYFGLTSMGLPLNMLVNCIFLLIVHPIIFGLTYLIERRCRDNNQSLVITWRELSVALPACALVFLFSNISYAAQNTPFSSRDPLGVFAIHSLTDLGGVWLLLAFHMQLCEFNARMEKEYLHKLLHMQKENYRVSAESVELVNRKYHDLKHQIQLLRSGVVAADKLQYLDEMEREIQSFEAQNKTGNKVLDTMLTAKSIQCQNLGIVMTCVADGKELDFMKPTDLSVLFGNALDNAIESAGKIEDSSKRLIHVSVVRQKRFVRIRIENCYTGQLRFVDGLPSTGKDTR